MCTRSWHRLSTIRRKQKSRMERGSWVRRQSSVRGMAWVLPSLGYNSELLGWKLRIRKRLGLSRSIDLDTPTFLDFGRKLIVPSKPSDMAKLVKLGIRRKHLPLRHQVFYSQVVFTSTTKTSNKTETDSTAMLADVEE